MVSAARTERTKTDKSPTTPHTKETQNQVIKSVQVSPHYKISPEGPYYANSVRTAKPGGQYKEQEIPTEVVEI